MNKVTRIGIGIAVVITVAGGSFAAIAATNVAPPSSSPTTSTSSSPALSSGLETASPTPKATATAWPYNEAANGGALFLKAAKTPGFLNGITIPSDAELVADGRSACVQLAGGVSFANVKVIAEDPHPVLVLGTPANQANSETIADFASELLCTEYTIENRPITAPTP